jgi:8-oxo-dGTP pyrophosphatase MutT (NUDIX family)
LKRATARKSRQWPRIRSRRTIKVSPWMSLLARTVEFLPGAPAQIYHAVDQADYVSIVARNRAGQIPLVWQYRPALEQYTWEVPAGMVDPGETPEDCCRRELLEEIGYAARRIRSLGDKSPCTGRLNNRVHSFFVELGEKTAKPEQGITVKWVSPAELVRLIKSGKFVSQLHLGSLMLADLHGYLRLPRTIPARRASRSRSTQ